MSTVDDSCGSVVSLVDCFAEIEDPRIARTRLHSLEEILVLSVLAVIAGAEGWEDIEDYGKHKLPWLRRFLKFENGIPSHDTISRLFRALKPGVFQEAFMTWVYSLHKELGFKQIAIDGKSLRRSHDRASLKKMLHSVCAWSVENHLVLGEQSVDEKSNEITAIPKLLDQLELKGAIVTIDAMGCQKEIAKKITDGGGEYLLGAKVNHPKLCEAIAEHFTAATKPTSRDSQFATFRQMKSVMASAARGHWGIENSLHWVLDMSFNEDQSRIRKDHGAENFGLLRRFAIGIIKQDTSKGSIRRKRKKAAWDDFFLLTLLQAMT